MGFPLLDVLGMGTKLIDKLIPDPKAKAEALLKLKELEQSGDLQAMTAQTEINKIEAASPNWWVAGWRPFIGWVCGLGLIMAYFVGPIAVWVTTGHFMAVDMTTLTPILMAMLGMAGLRTFEKVKDVKKNR